MPLNTRELFFQNVLDHLPGDLVVLDNTHRYIYVNPSAVGDPEVRAWIVGKTDFDYCELRGIDPALAEKRRDYFLQVLATGEPREWEESMTDRQGRERFYLRRLFPLRNPESGLITFMLGHGMEITDRVRLLENLNAERDFFQNVINAAPSLIFVKNVEGRLLLANRAMAELYGMTIDELIALNKLQVSAASDELKTFAAVDEQVRATGLAIMVEETVVKPDGSVCRLETTKLPLSRPGGEMAVLGVSNDITERIVKEKALQLSEFRLNQAQELTRSGSWNYHLLDRKLECSRGMYRIFEIDNIDKFPSLEYFKNVFHADDRVKLKDLIDDISKNPVTRQITCRIFVPSGEKYVNIMIQPMPGSDHKVEELFGTAVDITEQVRNERIMRRQEQHLNDAQEMARLGSFEFNPSTGEITWSKGMYRIWEIGDTVKPKLEWFYETVHEDDRDTLRQFASGMNPSIGSFIQNYRIITPAGKIKYVELHSKWQYDEYIGQHLLIGTAQDVTERRLQEESLRRNEQMLIDAQKIANSGSWELEVRGDHVEVKLSPGVYKIFDLDITEPLPGFEDFFSFVIPRDRSKVRIAFENILNKGLEQEFQHELLSATGKSKIVVARGVPIIDHDGKVIRAFGTTTDITERYLNEERLKLSEQGLKMAQSIARVGSFSIDLDDYSATWSQEMYRIWELDETEAPLLFDQAIASFIPDDRVRVLANITKLVETGEEISDEFSIRVGSGLKHIEIRSRLWRDESGAPYRIFGTVMDITQRKRYEEELVLARKEAEESYRAKENFLAGLSHELRTPLNGIIGMVRLLKKTNLNAPQREYADVLNQTAGNLLMIINDILDFAKLQSGNVELEQVVFNPAQVADTAVQLQMFKAEEKNIILRHLHTGDRPMPAVLGDPYRLNQILLNLLNNAVKYTNFGEVVLRHYVSHEDGENVTVEFCVEDTGIGIPDHFRERIFESFTQVHQAERSRGGVGLGLAITKQLVEQHGGRIWLESEPDVGSRFFFSIPYRKAAGKIQDRSSSFDAVIPDRFKVLLAEDNQVNQFITLSMMESIGAEVDLAVNGQEALDLAASKDYDIILMDIQMPVMDGIETALRIRTLSDRKRSRVPIIALTANTARQAHRNLLSSGMNDWLVKPFTEHSLYRKIGSQLKERKEFSDLVRKRKFPQRRRPETVEVSVTDNLYDLRALMKDMPGSDAFKRKMLVIFIENIPPVVSSIKESFRKDDLETISSLAHKIKPTLDGSGIQSLRETIRNIELCREKKRTREQLAIDISHLDKVITRVVNAFREEIAIIDGLVN